MPGRMGRLSPGPGASPRGTHSMTGLLPPRPEVSLSAGLASWAFF